MSLYSSLKPVLIIVLFLVLLKACVPLFVFNYTVLLSCVAAYCSVLVGLLLSGVAFVNIVIKHYRPIIHFIITAVVI